MSLNNLATMARLERLTLAIGEENFPSALLESVRLAGGVDHVMIFAFAPRCMPRNVINIGSVEAVTAAQAAERFSQDLYLLEQPLEAIMRHTDAEPAWLELGEPAEAHEDLQCAFLAACGISDRLSFVVARNDVRYFVQLLRTDGSCFPTAQRWLLEQLCDVVAAHVCKHFCYLNAVEGQNQFVLARVLMEAPLFSAVSPRERLVCVGILTGHTSESIAENLSISINSVLTYRKRLYEKLGISSQNELFVQVIDAMMSLSGQQERSDVESRLDAKASQARRNGRPLAANLAFAEAFFG